MISSNDFPRLTANNHRVTSPASPDYNCVAWAAGDTGHWWQPGVFWPTQPPPEDNGIGVLVQAFQFLGYEDCGLNAAFEPGAEKVALYGDSLYGGK